MIQDLFRMRRRFLRSAHLERDFTDPAALDGYVLTPQARSYLQRMASGLAAESGQRAWRITGDYGVGKSSFALVLARLFGGNPGGITPAVRKGVEFPAGHRAPRLLPVLVTGSREPIALAVLRALARALDGLHERGRRPRVLIEIRAALQASDARADVRPGLDAEVVQFVRDAAAFVRSARRGTGVLLVLDELGKFLEFSAARPEQQDVYFLQLLGESAARSGDHPIVVVGLLHQGFNAYADRLSDSAQREWQKVAGRFDELLFDRPLDQTAALLADATNVNEAALPRAVASRARDDMAAVVAMGWYGPRRRADDLHEVAPRLYPLHPTVLPVLSQLFARFGQNERSLFSFLLSAEPFGLQAFAERAASAAAFYRLPDLYDYARATFGHRLGMQSYRNHWNVIESVVESFATDRPAESRVLKAVAMLNLVDDQGLLALPQAIELAVATDDADRRAVRTAVERLHERRVLYARGGRGGYCLWPHTSVDIERVYAEARKAVQGVGPIADVIAGEFDTRPIVARRHYIETGNLRHFVVRCAAPAELRDAARPGANASPWRAGPDEDGVILLPLSETADDRRVALRFARSPAAAGDRALLVAVPQPLETLRAMALEAQRWQWVAEHTPELGHDRYAAEEVSRQVSTSRRMLRDRVQDLVGVRSFADRSELEWFHGGARLPIATGRELMSALSATCDRLYSAAPRVRNELVNRRGISSAAASARMRLIEGILGSPTSPLLGMDAARKPPEMSMYLSVLKGGRMHIVRDGTHAIVEPTADDDPLNVRLAFMEIRAALSALPDARVRVSDLFEALRRPPLGVRDGLSPLLLAIFAVANGPELAFYEDGRFLAQVTGAEFMRLIKEPASFEVQLCRVAGLRASVFARLARVLAPADAAPDRDASVVDVVKTLCVFAAELPPYARRTTRLTGIASAVRAALLNAREPSTLLFSQLPEACGFAAFGAGDRAGDGSVDAFVASLRTSLDELRAAYPAVLDEARAAVLGAVARPGTFAEVRVALAASAERLLTSVHEPKLRGLCLRLSDRVLADDRWIEALGGFVCGKPPGAWSDLEAARFGEEFDRLMLSYRRVEAAASHSGAAAGTFAVRVAMTSPAGDDVEQMLHLCRGDEPLVGEMEAAIKAIVARSRRAGLAATARVLWSELGGTADPFDGADPTTKT